MRIWSRSIYFLDTSIFIYAVGQPHRYKESCAELLRRIQSRRLKASTDVEVIQEILHIFRRRDEPDRGVILSSLIYSLGMKVLPVRSVDIKTAIFYYDKYKSLAIPSRDFVHLGIALNRSIKRIITTDRHFDSIDEVERIDPLDLF